MKHPEERQLVVKVFQLPGKSEFGFWSLGDPLSNGRLAQDLLLVSSHARQVGKERFFPVAIPIQTGVQQGQVSIRQTVT